MAQGILGTTTSTTGYLVIIRATGDEGMNEKLPIEVCQWMGIAKAMAQVSREHHRVSSESSGAVDDHR